MKKLKKNCFYSVYKKSDVEWLEKIPAHWTIKKLKRIMQFGYGGSLLSENRIHGAVPVYGSNGVVGFHNCSNTKQPCIIVGRKGSFGKVTYSKKSCFAIDTTFYIDSTLTDYNIRWIYYCLQCLRLDSFSKDSAVPGLSREDAYEKFLPYCISEEQKAIANFLDQMTKRIDGLIEKKEKQIKLLQEKRLALITHTVTKGLDPNVKMKDSGEEWIGQIPKHWKIIKLKYLATINDETLSESEDSDMEIKYVDIGNVDSIKGVMTTNEMYFRDVPTRARRIVRNGDVIFSTVRTYLKAIAPINNPPLNLIVSTGFAVIRLKLLNSSFSAYALRSHYFVEQAVSNSVGVSYPAINANVLAGLLICFPPAKEQETIGKFLDKETKKIDALLEKIKKSIELLKEYRSALITSVVTGKINVQENAEVIEIAQAQQVKKKPLSVFQKAVFGAEIVSQMKDDAYFGRTKFMKVLYLCEAHLNVPLEGKYKREAADPLDHTIYKIEGIMKQNKWFKIVQQGPIYKYKNLENPKGYKKYFDRRWKEYKKQLNDFLFLMKKFTTEQLEIIDTIYAVWNDFLIEGKKPSDHEIICEIKNNWHESKKRFSDKRLQKAIDWMRQQDIVPQGYGPQTLGKIR